VLLESLFAAHLAKPAKWKFGLTTFWKEHVDAIRGSGLRISGASEFTVRLNATSDPKSLPRCDYGIVATKAIHKRVALLKWLTHLMKTAPFAPSRTALAMKRFSRTCEVHHPGHDFPRGPSHWTGHIGFDIKGDTWIGPSSLRTRPMQRWKN